MGIEVYNHIIADCQWLFYEVPEERMYELFSKAGILRDDRRPLGLCQFPERHIYVNQDQRPRDRGITLGHEVLHAVIGEREIDCSRYVRNKYRLDTLRRTSPFLEEDDSDEEVFVVGLEKTVYRLLHDRFFRVSEIKGGIYNVGFYVSQRLVDAVVETIESCPKHYVGRRRGHRGICTPE